MNRTLFYTTSSTLSYIIIVHVITRVTHLTTNQIHLIHPGSMGVPITTETAFVVVPQTCSVCVYPDLDHVLEWIQEMHTSNEQYIRTCRQLHSTSMSRLPHALMVIIFDYLRPCSTWINLDANLSHLITDLSVLEDRSMFDKFWYDADTLEYQNAVARLRSIRFYQKRAFRYRMDVANYTQHIQHKLSTV